MIDAPPSLPRADGPHRITGRDADGAELFALRFEMPVIADGDGSSSFVFALPVREGVGRRAREHHAVRAGRIVHAGPEHRPADGDPARPRIGPDPAHHARPSPGPGWARSRGASGGRGGVGGDLQPRDSGSGRLEAVAVAGCVGAGSLSRVESRSLVPQTRFPAPMNHATSSPLPAAPSPRTLSAGSFGIRPPRDDPRLRPRRPSRAHAAGHPPARRPDAPTLRPAHPGGRILDGTGNPWFRADIGVRDGRIAALGRLAGATADRVIDATGRYVSPGFIDIHSHADDAGDVRRASIRNDSTHRKAAPNIVSQGATTVVVNQDGRSPWPIAEQRATLERQGVGPNVMLMVGHGTVRRMAMGNDFRRAATAAETDRMAALVRQALEEGATGISAGLEYVPGRWSTTDELVALVAELAPYDGVYISHERAEGADPMWFLPSQHEETPPTLLDAVAETIEIGRRTGVRVVASHIKAKGVGYWGQSAAAVEMIQQARDEGRARMGGPVPVSDQRHRRAAPS